MKAHITYLIFLCATFQLGCKVGYNRSFIKTSKQSDITLKSISKPYIIFVLEKGDTISFSTQDVYSLISKRLQKEVDRQGYSSSPHLAALANTIKELKADTVVYQNLSAVGDKTISDNLDTWIAGELLLAGQAEVSPKVQQQKPKTLKYVYTKDILGGAQGVFYTVDQKELYRTIIALGE